MAPDSDELLPVFFPSGRPTGQAFPRLRVHRLGLWHPTIHCWIVRRRAVGGPALILQHRDPGKDAWPDRLDTTAAGHLRLGETDPFREIEEELGVRPVLDQLRFLGVRRVDDIANQRLIDRELQHIYLWINDLPLQAYRIPAGEVEALVELALDDAEALHAGRMPRVPAVSHSSSGEVGEIHVTLDMLVPETDGATLNVIGAARRLLEDASAAAAVDGWDQHDLLDLVGSQ